MELAKHQKESISKIFDVLELGTIINLSPIESSQNIVYKVDTSNKSYIFYKK